MQNKPLISIIIPTLNEERVIGDSIGRIEKYLSIPHEIIISDGKSKDKTVELAQNAGAKVVEYNGTTRQTIAMGRNDGARIAQGEFLVFLDADCTIINPDQFFKKALDYFGSHKTVVAIAAKIRVSADSETWADRVVYIALNAYFSFLNNICGIGMAGGEFQMIRASAFKNVGGFNPTLVASEDVDLLYRLSRIGKTRMPELVVFHSGRRGHKVGWPRLIASWIGNTFSMVLFKKAHSKEWEEVR